VRNNYKWPWSKGAEYLYRELLRTLELEHGEAKLLELAKSKSGRKKKYELAARIHGLRAEGRTVREIREILSKEGTHLSLEGVEAYFKTRRRFPSLRR
jgi:hypothetical protein